MSDTQRTPVSGGDGHEGAPDGVSDAGGGPAGAGVNGRDASGESGGGSYPNPHRGKDGDNSGFMGHGGQTEIGYHGSGEAGEGGSSAPNAPTGSGGIGRKDENAGDTAPQVERTPHTIQAGGRTINVVESSGIAEAEATGNIGRDPDGPAGQRTVGSG